MSSSLFQEILEIRGLVYTINSFNQALKHAGVFGIYAGTTPKELEELLPVVADEIKKMMNDKVSETELKRAKTQIKASLLMSLESSSTTAEIMARQMLLFKRRRLSRESKRLRQTICSFWHRKFLHQRRPTPCSAAKAAPIRAMTTSRLC